MTAPTGLDGQFELLRLMALEILRGVVDPSGNGLTPVQRRAQDQIVTMLAEQALGMNPGRFAYALPCGGGKTQGTVALVAAARLLRPGLSFAVAASTIRALCCIKRDLMKAGVPESDIGIRHGKTAKELDAELKHEGVPLEARANTGDQDRPIMLVSHELIRGAKNGTLFVEHNGQPRSLLIWDETLFTAESAAMPVEDPRTEVPHLRRQIPIGSPLVAFLAAALARIEAETLAQSSGSKAQELDLAEGHDLCAVRREAYSLHAGVLRQTAIACAKKLVDIAERPVSVSVVGKSAIVHHRIAVDPSWKNIAVLDASYPIRLLAKAVGLEDRTTSEMRDFRTYEDVLVRQHRVAASKSSQRDWRVAKDVALRVAEIIHAVVAGESVLVFVCKEAAAALKRNLASEGIYVGDAPMGQARVHIATWGTETGTNAFRDCKHVIFAGLPRLPMEAIVAQLAGEADSTAHRVSAEELMSVFQSEVCHSLIQGLHRCNCRQPGKPGRAGAMTAHIIDAGGWLRETLSKALPGIRWESDDPKKAESRTGRAQQAVIDALSTVPVTVTEISSDALKRAAIAASGLTLGLAGWTKAIKEAAAQLNFEGGLVRPEAGRWRQERRKLVRI